MKKTSLASGLVDAYQDPAAVKKREADKLAFEQEVAAEREMLSRHDHETLLNIAALLSVHYKHAQPILENELPIAVQAHFNGLLKAASARKEIARRAGKSNAARYDPLKEKTKELAIAKRYNSRRDAAKKIAPHILELSDRLGFRISESQSETTIYGWLAEMRRNDEIPPFKNEKTEAKTKS